MKTLPAFTAPVADVSAAIAAVRTRMADAWRADPVDGPFEAPFLEFATRAESWLFLAALASWPVWLVVLLLADGGLPWGAFALAVGTSVAAKIVSARNVARIRARRRSATVVPAFWFQANTALFDASSRDDAYADFLFSLDPARTDDLALLGRIGSETHERLPYGSPEPADRDGRIVWNHVHGSFGKRCTFPTSWTGGVAGIRAAGVKVPRADLPGGVLSDRVTFLLVGPDDTLDSAEWLPRAVWYREDVQALLEDAATPVR